MASLQNYSSWIKSDDKSVMFLMKKGMNFPSLILMTNDGGELQNSLDITVLQAPEISREGICEIASKIKNNSSRDEANLFIRGLQIPTRQSIKYMSELTKKKPFQLSGAQQISQYLLDLTGNPNIFQKIFQHKVDFGSGENIQLRDMTIILDKRQKQEKIDDFFWSINKASDIMDDAGLGFLRSGAIIRFSEIHKNQSGTYHSDADFIHISPRGNRQSMTKTFIHELGHRAWRVFLSPKEIEVINDKFNELMRTGVFRKENEQRIQAFMQEKNLERFKVGDVIQNFTKKGWKDEQFIIKSINSKQIVCLAVDGKSQISMEPIVLSKFKKVDEPSPSMELVESTDIPEYSGWSPSTYSTKNKEEWFCENLAYISCGKCQNQDLLDLYNATLKRLIFEHGGTEAAIRKIDGSASTKEEQAFETNNFGQMGFSF